MEKQLEKMRTQLEEKLDTTITLLEFNTQLQP